MTRTSEPFTALVSAENLSRMRRFSGVLCLVFSVSAAMLSAQAKDVAGSRDHPMISRFEGASIAAFEQKEFDEYRLVTGPVSSRQPDGKPWEGGVLHSANSVGLEGKVWRFRYAIPKNRSTLELIRTYEAALKKSGFEIMFQCSLNECAGGPKPATVSSSLDWHGQLTRTLMGRWGIRILDFGSSVDQRFVSARLKRKEGDIYVSVLALTFREPMALLDVVEVEPLTPDGVTVNAATMASDIATQGSVALYGIHFDNDQAEVKAESRSTISEIAAFLRQNPKMELIVVGHTDKNGTLEHNLDLSLRRAQAVVTILVSDFGVARNRLDPRGVGFLAPVSPNETEQGRARNRRVQLVRR